MANSAFELGGGGGAAAATKAQQQTGTSTDVYVSPGTQQYHTSAAKMWLVASSIGTIVNSYNVASLVDVGTGDITVNVTNAFANIQYPIAALGSKDATTSNYGYVTIDEAAPAPTVSAFNAYFAYNSTTLIDPNRWLFVAFGDQA